MMKPVTSQAGGVLRVLDHGQSTRRVLDHGDSNSFSTRVLEEAEALLKGFRPGCEYPGLYETMPYLSMDLVVAFAAQCNRCYGCHRQKWAQAYRRIQAGFEEIVQSGMACMACSREQYGRRYMRLMTLTVLSPQYMGVNEYTLEWFRLELKAVMQELTSRWTTWSLQQGMPLKPEYWMSLEPQGPRSKHRLHVHVLMFNVPTREFEWDAAADQDEDDPAPVLARWSQSLFENPRARFGRWLWNGHRGRPPFWGATSCVRVDSIDGSMDYMLKELTTSDIDFEAGDTRALLDAIYKTECTDRRVRTLRYSSGFASVLRSPVDSRRDKFERRVNIYRKGRFSPEWSNEALRLRLEKGPPVTPQMEAELRTQEIRAAYALLADTSRAAVWLMLVRARAASREAQTLRARRDRLLGNLAGAPREVFMDLEDRWPDDVVALTASAAAMAEEFHRYRDEVVGFRPWFAKEQRSLQEYADGVLGRKAVPLFDEEVIW